MRRGARKADRTRKRVVDDYDRELDRQTQKMVGMSLSEFRDKAESGGLAATPAIDYLCMAAGVSPQTGTD